MHESEKIGDEKVHILFHDFFIPAKFKDLSNFHRKGLCLQSEAVTQYLFLQKT